MKCFDRFVWVTYGLPLARFVHPGEVVFLSTAVVLLYLRRSGLTCVYVWTSTVARECGWVVGVSDVATSNL